MSRKKEIQSLNSKGRNNFVSRNKKKTLSQETKNTEFSGRKKFKVSIQTVEITLSPEANEQNKTLTQEKKQKQKVSRNNKKKEVKRKKEIQSLNSKGTYNSVSRNEKQNETLSQETKKHKVSRNKKKNMYGGTKKIETKYGGYNISINKDY